MITHFKKMITKLGEKCGMDELDWEEKEKHEAP